MMAVAPVAMTSPGVYPKPKKLPKDRAATEIVQACRVRNRKEADFQNMVSYIFLSYYRPMSLALHMRRGEMGLTKLVWLLVFYPVGLPSSSLSVCRTVTVYMRMMFYVLGHIS